MAIWCELTVLIGVDCMGLIAQVEVTTWLRRRRNYNGCNCCRTSGARTKANSEGRVYLQMVGVGHQEAAGERFGLSQLTLGNVVPEREKFEELGSLLCGHQDSGVGYVYSDRQEMLAWLGHKTEEDL